METNRLIEELERLTSAERKAILKHLLALTSMSPKRRGALLQLTDMDE